MDPNDQQDCQYAGDYRIDCLLGEGGQAIVYLGVRQSKLFALKVYCFGSNKEQAFKTEVEFLQHIHFPNLINMVDKRISAPVKVTGQEVANYPLVVLELAEGGELFDYLSKTGSFSADVCRSFFKQLISAVDYLNHRGITHRDLKPENILFDENFTLKVSDFGLSRDNEGDNHDYKLRSIVGTEGYRPPEMEMGKYLGLQADLFACGVLLFLMYKGTPPFLSTKSHDRHYRLIREKQFGKFWSLHEKGKEPGFFPDSFKRLINSFFSAEVERRPTLDGLKDDQWLNGDTAMGNDVKAYMKKRFDVIKETDATKRRIEQLRIQIMQQNIIEEENQECRELDRSIKAFVQDYKGYQVDSSKLSKYNKYGVSYVSQNPTFVLAWVKAFFRESFETKDCFIKDFIYDEIEPLEYLVRYDEAEQLVEVSLKFEMDGDTVLSLEINGKMHLNGEKTGIEWIKTHGNDFWLSNIVNALTVSLSNGPQ